jgi:hypothetical protein
MPEGPMMESAAEYSEKPACAAAASERVDRHVAARVTDGRQLRPPRRHYEPSSDPDAFSVATVGLDDYLVSGQTAWCRRSDRA